MWERLKKKKKKKKNKDTFLGESAEYSGTEQPCLFSSKVISGSPTTVMLKLYVKN